MNRPLQPSSRWSVAGRQNPNAFLLPQAGVWAPTRMPGRKHAKQTMRRASSDCSRSTRNQRTIPSPYPRRDGKTDPRKSRENSPTSWPRQRKQRPAPTDRPRIPAPGPSPEPRREPVRPPGIAPPRAIPTKRSIHGSPPFSQRLIAHEHTFLLSSRARPPEPGQTKRD